MDSDWTKWMGLNRIFGGVSYRAVFHNISSCKALHKKFLVRKC